MGQDGVNGGEKVMTWRNGWSERAEERERRENAIEISRYGLFPGGAGVGGFSTPVDHGYRG